MLSRKSNTLYSVVSLAGIEPASPPSEGDILSVEIQGHMTKQRDNGIFVDCGREKIRRYESESHTAKFTASKNL